MLVWILFPFHKVFHHCSSTTTSDTFVKQLFYLIFKFTVQFYWRRRLNSTATAIRGELRHMEDWVQSTHGLR